MSEQKAKLFIAAFSAIFVVSLLIASSYSIFPSKEGINASPMASPTAQPTMEPSTGTPTPAPTASPPTSNYSPIPINVDISPDPVKADHFVGYIVRRGESVSLEVNVTSISEIEYTVPLYLAIDGYENHVSDFIVIATPPEPYSSQLPWPSNRIDKSNDTLPLTATFDINPLTIEPMGNVVSRMTLKAAENATVGSYMITIGLDKQSHRGTTGFFVRVDP